MTHFPRTSQPDIRSRTPLEALALRPASGHLARFPTTRASSRTHCRLNSVHTPGTICQWPHSDQPSLIDAHLGITSTSMLRPRLTRSTDIASLPFHVTLVVCISNSFIFIVVPSIDAEMNTRFHSGLPPGDTPFRDGLEVYTHVPGSIFRSRRFYCGAVALSFPIQHSDTHTNPISVKAADGDVSVDRGVLYDCGTNLLTVRSLRSY